MKTLKCLLLCTALTGAMLAVSSPKPATDAGRDVIDTAMSVHKFDTFLMLVRDADLTYILKESGPITVFAPTDDAFKKMPEGLLERIHGNKPRLRDFVLHHIVNGSLTAEQAVQGYTVSLLDGSKLHTGRLSGQGKIGNVGFSMKSARASNGILNEIDAVLMHR